jgi:hypothetical protein
MGPRWTDLDTPSRFKSGASILDSAAEEKGGRANDGCGWRD